MRSSTRKQKSRFFSRVSLVGLIVMGASFLMLLILFLCSLGNKDGLETLLVYSPKEDISISFKSAINRIDYEVVEIDDLSSEEISEYDEPLLIINDGALDSIESISSYVKGIIIVEPSDVGLSTSGKLKPSYPATDISIFATKDNETARLLYERISGDDTLYGTKSTVGGLLSSSIYVNEVSTRFFSWSSLNIPLLSSPLFHIELSSFISSVYEDGTPGTFTLIAPYIFYALSVFLFVFGAFLYLSGTKNLPQIKDKLTKKLILCVGIVFLLLSLISSLVFIIDKLKPIAFIGPLLLPSIFGLSSISLKKINIKTSKETPKVLIYAGSVFLFLLMMLLFGGLKFSILVLFSFFIVFILNTISSSYKFIFSLMALILPLSYLIAYLISGNDDIGRAFISSFILIVVPSAISYPIMEKEQNKLIFGLTNAFVYSILLSSLLSLFN